MRTDQEKKTLVAALDELNYFRAYVSNSAQRKEFIEEVAQYAKYVFYPKGAIICNHGISLLKIFSLSY